MASRKRQPTADDEQETLHCEKFPEPKAIWLVLLLFGAPNGPVPHWCCAPMVVLQYPVPLLTLCPSCSVPQKHELQITCPKLRAPLVRAPCS